MNQQIDIFEIIEKYYKKDSALYNILVNHSQDVMRKAVSIAEKHPELNIDKQFVEEAAMLHDIGISMTFAPGIECYGVMPYLCHGYLGREILDNEGLPKHGLVCERHTGAGLSVADIESLSVSLPLRNMIPETIEEEVICFSDCFFSKTKLGQEKSVEKVREELARYTSDEGMKRFDSWCEKFL